MPAMNCWEFKKCGREPGGHSYKELGICPVAVEVTCHGVNHGKNGGRCCWAIGKTLCGGKIQGNFAQKLAECSKCDWYIQIRAEEGKTFRTYPK